MVDYFIGTPSTFEPSELCIIDKFSIWMNKSTIDDLAISGISIHGHVLLFIFICRLDPTFVNIKSIIFLRNFKSFNTVQ